MQVWKLVAIDKADAIYVENSTAIMFCDFHMSEYHLAGWLVSTEQITDCTIPLRDAGLLHLNQLSALFHMYGPGYSCCTLSVNFHFRMRAEDVPTPLICGKTIGRQFLIDALRFCC